ncbi:hypothetical protein ACOMHN_067367 [Nucella lapillus]
MLRQEIGFVIRGVIIWDRLLKRSLERDDWDRASLPSHRDLDKLVLTDSNPASLPLSTSSVSDKIVYAAVIRAYKPCQT